MTDQPSLKNAYALLIGVGNDLPVTIGDANAIYDLLINEELAGYLPQNITLLTEKKATRENILDAFEDLIAKVDSDSSVLLYYSGHGGTYSDNDFLKKENWKPESENRKYFHLCPFDYDPVNYKTTWVKAEEVRNMINALQSRRLIFFLDCCHAAGMVQNPTVNGITSELKAEADGLAQNLDTGRGMSIISSCRENQESYIMEGDTNSLFTKCMLEVLEGQDKKDIEDPFVRISEVVRYIFKKVPENHPEQNPYANLQIYDDFIVSRASLNAAKEALNILSINSLGETSKNVKKQIVDNFRTTENANNLIIFVHGFSGAAESTFGSIPSLLMKQEKLDGWDMIPVGYAENINPEMGHNVWASTTDIQIISSYLATSIKHNYSKYKRIAIVAHSLGGLVVQEAILSLKDDALKKISHLLLFGTPSAGISDHILKELKQKNLKDLSEQSGYIKNLRQQWNTKFANNYPFSFKTVAATKDSFVPISSSLEPFSKEYTAMIEGDHFSMVSVENEDNDSFGLIINTLTDNTFHSKFSSSEEINIALGNYEHVIKTLLPKTESLDAKGLEQLVFALEGADRAQEALALIETKELARGNSNLMGIIGGRFKRNYLNSFTKSDGQNAYDYYKKGLVIAENKDDFRQVYYLAINLAFLSLVYYNDISLMTEYAEKTLLAVEKDPFNSLWKIATLGEVYLYKGDFDTSKTYYAQAAKMSGIREKISIYTNANNAYMCLMSTDSPDEDFIKFLKSNFLA